jgi:hypothetical protein
LRIKPFLASLVFCLTLGQARPGLTDSSPIPADLLDRLQKQGWTQVSSGVMQRSLGSRRVETLGFGANGLRFQLEELRAHLANLRKAYAQQPSPELRIAIRAQRAQILRVEKAWREAKAADGLGLAAEALVVQGANCSANYDASAIAFPLAKGAGAKATAYFNSACSATGEVYAHSVSTATAADNTVTTRTQSDPVPGGYTTGANVSANVSTSAEGSTGCDSYAYASVNNYGFDPVITYQQTDRNYECTATLPAPWGKTDVGAVGLAGSTSYDKASGVFKLIAGGTDLAGTADAFHFVHQTLTGDGEIVANVAALLKPAGANRTLAGVTFRNDLAAGSMHATMTITSEGAAQFRRRTTAGGSTLSDGPGVGTTFAPRWLKLVRSGNVFTASLSADGMTWTQVHTPQTVPMAATVHVGLVALRNGSTAPTGAVKFEHVSFGTVFRQDFQSSTSVASYVNATAPNLGQLNDISAKAEGGTWSIQQGRLQLVRTGSGTTENDAGIARFTDFFGPPSLLHITFDLGVSAWTVSRYQSSAFVLYVGRYDGFIDYNSGGVAANTFQRLFVEGEGPGLYAFSAAGVKSAPFSTDGAPHRVALFLNKSATAANYRAPDGTLQTLRSNGVALWVDLSPVIVDAAALNGSSSALTDLRMQWSQPEDATWTLDNFEVRSYFPQ